MLIFEKDYEGFESLSDIERDIIECFDPQFNEKAKDIPSEFEGTVKVVITYTPDESIPDKRKYWEENYGRDESMADIGPSWEDFEENYMYCKYCKTYNDVRHGSCICYAR